MEAPVGTATLTPERATLPGLKLHWNVASAVFPCVGVASALPPERTLNVLVVALKPRMPICGCRNASGEE